MVVIFSVITTILLAIIVFVGSIWLYFLLYIVKSYKQSPVLEPFNKPSTNNFPKVSIIVPARNEEKYIGKCLDSLLKQDYPNYEIVAINDSSSDMTGKILQLYQIKNSDKIIVIDAGSSSDDEWTGKNWACYQGYLKSTGEIFLFTDADTIYSSSSTISLAVDYLSKQKLDALTLRPKIRCESIWTKITFPLLWSFSYITYSALRVNNSKTTKSGYFFGCFYLITRRTYEAIGTHKAVKNEIVEDAALGEKVKQRHKLKMVQGDHHIYTIMTANFSTLLQGLRRSINLIPFSFTEKTSVFTMLFLLVIPFFLLPISIFSVSTYNTYTDNNHFNQLLLIINLITIVLLFSITVAQSNIGLLQNPIYSSAFPVACTLISIAFILFIINRKRSDTINWQGRKYTISKKAYTICSKRKPFQS